MRRSFIDREPRHGIPVRVVARTVSTAIALLVALALVAGTAIQSASASELDRAADVQSSAFSAAEPAPPIEGRDSVIGKDTRTRLSNAASRSNPARGVVFINSTAGQCTGFLIATNRVATAGHCLENGGTKIAANQITVRAGRNGGYRPYKGCRGARTWVHSNYLSHSRQGRADAARGYDYGIIVLNCHYSSGQVLNLLQSTYRGRQLRGRTPQIVGYPGDKPWATAWKSVGALRELPNTVRRIDYTNDTFGGMSGAPVYVYDARKPCGKAYCVIGIHTRPNFGTGNSGVRISPSVYTDLLTR